MFPFPFGRDFTGHIFSSFQKPKKQTEASRRSKDYETSAGEAVNDAGHWACHGGGAPDLAPVQGPREPGDSAGSLPKVGP